MYFRASPLNGRLVSDLCNGEMDVLRGRLDTTTTSRLKDVHGWSSADCRKAWAFGPDKSMSNADPCNLIADASTGVQYMAEIKDSVCTAFKMVAQQGALCGEPLRGVHVSKDFKVYSVFVRLNFVSLNALFKFEITDANIHADPPHRSGAQIIPAARHALHEAQLRAEPVILEVCITVSQGLTSTEQTFFHSAHLPRGDSHTHGHPQGGPHGAWKAAWSDC